MGPELIAIAGIIIWIIIGTSYLKWHPFIVLLLAAIGLAFLLGIPATEVPGVISEGFGNMFAAIGLLILFGSWIGVSLEATNGTTAIARGILKALSRLPMQYVLGFLGYLVSIPVFCDAAFVILAPIAKKLSRGSKKYKNALVVALSTGLFSSHVLVPPTPGPLAAAANLQLKNISLLLLFGGLLAFLLMLSGATFAYFMSGKNEEELQAEDPVPSPEYESTPSLPSFRMAILPLLIPIFLMALQSIVPLMIDEKNIFLQIISFLGSPTIALLLGAVAGFWMCFKHGTNLYKIIEKGILQAAPILLITAMGGALGKIIGYASLTDNLGLDMFQNSWGLALPFLLSALLKSAQGSSTVAIITVSSLMFPLLGVLGLDSEMGKVWVILAVGAGAVTVSHANDSYFWIVSQMGELPVKQAYKTHTLATLIQGITGLIIILAGHAMWQVFYS
ncbi:GntP family permease [Christiangramia crocea]|uniref:GntP family permease n=1 Tax=Christiangramia crocea TaxID=2904124 RepID=A0A9X1UVX7_9FLAO|nr:GntP family permease [Gramella crocea]MCG9971273.1 GntP family permease [Gramella crocea]